MLWDRNLSLIQRQSGPGVWIPCLFYFHFICLVCMRTWRPRHFHINLLYKPKLMSTRGVSGTNDDGIIEERRCIAVREKLQGVSHYECHGDHDLGCTSKGLWKLKTKKKWFGRMILKNHRGNGSLVPFPIHLLEYQRVDDDISRRIKEEKEWRPVCVQR